MERDEAGRPDAKKTVGRGEMDEALTTGGREGEMELRDADAVGIKRGERIKRHP